MPQFEKIISFRSKEGHEYLIQFKRFNNEYTNYNIPIIDISLISTNEILAYNSLESLLKITSIIEEYLISNDAVLYFYCDTKELNRRNKKITPQEFRSKLFTSLFEIKTKGDKSMCIKNYIINDGIGGDHFISVISNIKNKYILDDINKLLESFYKN